MTNLKSESTLNLVAIGQGTLYLRIARMWTTAFLFMFSAVLTLSLQEVFASEIWLGDWLQTNTPRVVNYLTSLGPADIGKQVAGIELSDGSVVLGGYKYLGTAVGLGKGVHVYLFSHKQKKYAYIWIDPTGEKLPLPDCSELDQEMTGKGSYVLSGDVYTWKYVRPGDGVVFNVCPKKSWFTAIPSK